MGHLIDSSTPDQFRRRFIRDAGTYFTYARHYDAMKRYSNLGFLFLHPSNLVSENARKYNSFELA